MGLRREGRRWWWEAGSSNAQFLTNCRCCCCCRLLPHPSPLPVLDEAKETVETSLRQRLPADYVKVLRLQPPRAES